MPGKKMFKVKKKEQILNPVMRTKSESKINNPPQNV